VSDPGDGQPPPPDQPHPEVGSVGDEAAKLLGVLGEWARDSGGGAGLGQSLGGLAGHAADTLREVDQHVATGAPECAYCPLCRTVHVVRSASPEVRAHLATAASSLLQAVAGVLASLPQTGAGRDGAPGAEFERIDLDGDDE